MRTYISDIFPKLKEFSNKLDNLTMLTNQHWISLDSITANKTVYIFRSNNELLVSTNGKVEKAKWEYLGNQSLLIDKTNDSYLFKHGFFDENKYEGELNTIERVIDFLNRTYLNPKIKQSLENSVGRQLGKVEINGSTYQNSSENETDAGQTMTIAIAIAIACSILIYLILSMR